MQTQRLDAAQRAVQRRLDTLVQEHTAALVRAKEELSTATSALLEHQNALRTKRQRTADAAQQATEEAAAAQKAAAASLRTFAARWTAGKDYGRGVPAKLCKFLDHEYTETSIQDG